MTLPTWNRKNLNSRILIFSLLMAFVPLAVFLWRVEVSYFKVERDKTKLFETYARSTIDTVERNLFERYGDAQAFAANATLLDRASWYQQDENQNGIVKAANKYMDLYDIYSVMIIVDLEGRPIAVNSRDADYKPVDNSAIYEMNFKNEKWFKDVVAERYLTSDVVSGTVVEDVYVDPLVKKAVGGNGMAISYSSPVFNDAGEMIAIWNNRVSFGLVNSVLEDIYRNYQKAGIDTLELTLLDRDGRVIVDLDPSLNDGRVEANDNMNVLMNLNLAQKGVEAAQLAIQGETGSVYSLHARKQIDQIAGFSYSSGALGYPGLGWSILVRQSRSEVMAAIIAAQFEAFAIFGISLILVGIAAWRMAKAISNPIKKLSEKLVSNASRTLMAASSVDEYSQQLADGSSKQAASVEETSSSLEELAAMTDQNSQNAASARDHMNQANQLVASMNGVMESLSVSMGEISEASEETRKIVKTIDEIAFQTNILALNAAVEAARAGEAGAGFAVVADEVRSLAGRAAEAARNTSSLIESNMSKIESGVSSVGETEEGFKQIQVKTGEVGSLIDQIAAASEQQNSGLIQVNSAISEISDVTQQNASGAEEAASSAKDMTGQARGTQNIAFELEVIVKGNAASAQGDREGPLGIQDSMSIGIRDRASKLAHSEELIEWN